MAGFCPDLGTTDGLAGPLLDTIDCHIAASVERSYGALFGQGALFSQVLTIILTLYVAAYAYQLILGRAQLSINSLVPKIMLIGLVLALASNWATYQILVQDIVFKGPEQIASAIMPSNSRATADMADRLDVLFARVTETATHWGTAAREIKPVPNATVNGAAVAVLGLQQGPALASNLLWISAGLFMLASTGLLVVAKVMLGVLLGLGPVFLVLMIFPQTRGLFEGWLKACVLFALVPLVTILLTSATLELIEPLIAQIVVGDRAGVLEMKNILTLLFAVVIFCGAMWQTTRLASTIATSWHLPGGKREASSVSDAPIALREQPTSSSDAAARIGQLVSSIERGDLTAGDAAGRASRASADDRRRAVVALSPASQNSMQASPELMSSALAQRRLGQTFRAPRGAVAQMRLAAER